MRSYQNIHFTFTEIRFCLICFNPTHLFEHASINPYIHFPAEYREMKLAHDCCTVLNVTPLQVKQHWKKFSLRYLSLSPFSRRLLFTVELAPPVLLCLTEWRRQTEEEGRYNTYAAEVYMLLYRKCIKRRSADITPEEGERERLRGKWEGKLRSSVRSGLSLPDMTVTPQKTSLLETSVFFVKASVQRQ